MTDYEKIDEELLPCRYGGCTCIDRRLLVYCSNCSKRPAVAQRMREIHEASFKEAMEECSADAKQADAAFWAMCCAIDGREIDEWLSHNAWVMGAKELREERDQLKAELAALRQTK